MRFYLIAGEASGDLHGSNLMKSIKKIAPQTDFRYFGGDLMQAEGGTLVKHISTMAFMGFVEVVMNLRKIFRNLNEAKHDILAYRPDALILIDFPGFNLKIAEFAKANGIKVFYYISPKVWAWNQKRVLKIKRVVDYMLCILPFEVDFYKSWGMEVFYVGNPLMDAIESHTLNPNFAIENNLSEKPIVALLPGSRKQEIQKLLPEMIKTIKHFPDFQFVVAGAPNFNKEYYREFLAEAPVPIVFNSTYDLLKYSSAAVVASGTATLETALLHIPEVVVYKGNPLSIAIARMLIKINFISLVNLIMNKEVVKELIQNDVNEEKITNELTIILKNSSYRSEMLKNFQILSEKVGKIGASDKTASFIVKTMTANSNLK
ncbi:lipid-A-disaccharide synthase [Pedobacter sp. HMF7647]|uniref:Lipid-A-disaccharide synthase n=1 Tax=Hufsiella arboris TaxID=2695275 RepID=A0A7K1YFA7_9SPHI|nr:lipid-A-disaccharide synthase [Hufsiella arboris]MXV52669.1 lipid-A-disaccharide synthase [Hufsiella arboris]